MTIRITRDPGFTLIEVLIASLILLITATAMTRAIVAGQMISHEALHNERATSLAQALMAEIDAHPYYDPEGGGTPGPESGESGRINFDNIDDFHGYNESAGNLVDASGIKYPTEFQAFSRRVSAVYGTFKVTPFSQTTNGINVTVIVRDETRREWTISRFIPADY